MTKRQIEMWTVELIERAIAKHHVEDTHVELKTQWPEVSSASKAREVARMIAGQANAARGEPILWLIGVDEKGGRVTGADPLEFSNWFAAVKAQFDGVVPSLTDINVTYEEQTVVTLYFETDRSPFVVRNPVHSCPGGGPVGLEVPWREGRSTRSATRLDLLRLLAPVQKLPELEVLASYMGVLPNKQAPETPTGLIWIFRVEYFGAPPPNTQVVIPTHNRGFDINFDGERFPDYSLQHVVFGQSIPSESSLIRTSDAQAILNGPGRFSLEVTRHTKPIDMLGWDKTKPRILITFHPVNSERPFVQEVWLRPAQTEGTAFSSAYWTLDRDRR